MPGTRDTAARTPGTGESIGVLKSKRIADNVSDVKIQQMAISSAPLSLIKVIHQSTSTAKNFPVEENSGATGLTVSSGSGTAVVLSGTPVCDPVGLLFMLKDVTNASNDWEVFKVTDWDGTTGLTLNRALPASLTSGDTFLFLIDCADYSRVYVKIEANTTGTGALTKILPLYYDFPRTAELANEVKRIPYQFVGSELQADAFNPIITVGNGFDIQESGYAQFTPLVLDVIGIMGLKLRVRTTTGSVALSVWAGAV